MSILDEKVKIIRKNLWKDFCSRNNIPYKEDWDVDIEPQVSGVRFVIKKNGKSINLDLYDSPGLLDGPWYVVSDINGEKKTYKSENLNIMAEEIDAELSN